MRVIVVTHKLEGGVEIEALGFKGAACEKATAAIEVALGSRQGQKKKPEYHQHETRGSTQAT